MTERNDCSFWEGFAGDDLSIPFQLIDENGDPEALSDSAEVTEIVGQFLSGNGAGVEVKLTGDAVTLVDGGVAGRGILLISSTVSATLKTDRTRKQTFTIYIIKAGKKKTWSFDGGLLLKPRPIPAVP